MFRSNPLGPKFSGDGLVVLKYAFWALFSALVYLLNCFNPKCLPRNWSAFDGVPKP